MGLRVLITNIELWPLRATVAALTADFETLDLT